MNKEFLPTPEYQLGRGGCETGAPCQFHAAKVSGEFTGVPGVKGSVNPSESVWKLPPGSHWRSLSESQKHSMHDKWSVWQEQAKKEGRYPAGSWMSSPEQLEQFVETVQVLKKKGHSFGTYLRVGTASGNHTRQELHALSLAGVSNVKVSLVEPCLSPILESKALLGSHAGFMFQSVVEQLPESQHGKWNIITSHFTESFVPTIEEFTDTHMDHTSSLAKKQGFYKKIFDLLAPHGVLVTCIGTGVHPRRMQRSDEIVAVLSAAGFEKQSVSIVPTTESLDYQNGQYLPGNYFVVAMKGKTI